jgi:SOS response regulatory protein OraA/RecX
LSSRDTDEPSTQDLAAQTRNAFALILAKLGRRDHTEKELLAALARKGYSEEAAVSALHKARREGLVNDERLAGRIARTSARSGQRGPRRVELTLRQKGIAQKTAQEATKAAFTASEEAEENLVRFATRLLRRARGETAKDKRIRVIRSLLTRGFPLSDAGKAVGIAENALMNENKKDDPKG